MDVSHGINLYYASRIVVPLSGDPAIPLYTSSGLIVATGFRRIVVGGRGPYVEFDDQQVVRDSILLTPIHHYYYDEWRTKDSANVKLYHQRATVSYADYLVGMWYVAPYLLFLADGRRLLQPPPTPSRAEDPKTIFD
jgi:hypothetical protein